MIAAQIRFRRRCALTLALFAAGSCYADNTAGVFGPVVNPNQRVLEYRIGHDPKGHDLVQRIHYQDPIGTGTNLRWRIVAQSRKRTERTVDFDFVQAEFLAQLPDLATGWRQGLRIDARVAGDDRPGLIAAAYIQDRQIGARWGVRALGQLSRGVGTNRPSGLGLQGRGHLRYRLNDRATLGLEWFGFFGQSAELPELRDQVHQLGPYLNWRMGQRWQLFAGILFGATSASDNFNMRLWLGRRL